MVTFSRDADAGCLCDEVTMLGDTIKGNFTALIRSLFRLGFLIASFGFTCYSQGRLFVSIGMLLGEYKYCHLMGCDAV